MALSRTSEASVEEKYAWAFELCDISDKGEVSHDDIIAAVKSIYETVRCTIHYRS